MTLNVRLPGGLEKKIDALVRATGVTKSDLVRRWIEKGIEDEAGEGGKSPYLLWRQIFTPRGSGRGNLGREAKKIVREKIRASRTR